MSTVTVEGANLRYDVSGERSRPVIAFVPDIGFGPWMWGWQASALAGPYRTVVFANRGTDGSDRAPPYTLDRFAADLEAVLADAGIRRAHLVGAGIGGTVAIQYAREYGRARSVSLLGAVKSADRIDRDALEALYPADPKCLEASLSVAFTDRFLANSDKGSILAWRDEDASGDALSGHKSAALEFRSERLYELSLPAFVCHGIDDPIAPLEAGEELAAELPRGRFEPVEGRRCFYIEHAAAVTDAIEEFVLEIESETD